MGTGQLDPRRVGARMMAMGLMMLATACGGGGGGDTVVPRVVASVDVSPPNLALQPGQGAPLTATAREANGTAIVGLPVVWSSTNPAVATVSAVGLVTGVADGIASITATIGAISGSAAVVVRTPVASVTVTPPLTTVNLGDASVQLVATPRDGAGNALTNRTIVWTSAAPAVATVSPLGVVTAVAPGNATITATSEGVSGTAAIQVNNNPCSIVRPIAVGQTATGMLTPTDCKLSDSTAIQRYGFTLPSRTTVEILMTSTAVDPYLFLTDDELNVLNEDDDGGAGLNARILRTLPAGRYEVLTNTFAAGSFGAYQLTLRQAPAACSAGRPLTLPAAVNAGLSTQSCQLNDGSFEDRYDFTLTTRTTIAIGMTSTSIDPIAILIDDQERIIAQDDDSGEGFNAAMEVQLEPGRYTVLARGYPQENGTYRLSVGSPADPCAVNRTLAIGQPIAGTLATSDCRLQENGGAVRFLQRFGVTLAGATSLQVDMTSSAVDAYLFIQNAQTGATVAENDDASNSTTNSRIIASLPAGAYVVNATTFGAGQVGPFQLSASVAQVSNINLSVSPTTLTLTPGQTQQVNATISGTTNNVVTWQSSAPNVVSVSNTGLVRALTAGTATVTAASQADPRRTANVSVTVTQSSAEPNLDIAAMYLVQTVQQLDGRIPLVAERQAVARVFVRGSRAGLPAAPVRVRVFEGANVVGTYTGTATPTLNVDESCCSANINIPFGVIKPGISVLAEVDPDNTVTEANENDNRFPLSGTPQPLTVVAVPVFSIRIVPVTQNRNNQTGAVAASLFNTFRSVWPVGPINALVRTPLVIDYVVNTQGFDDWARLVRDMEILRQTEGGADYYYGLLRTRGSSGVLGLANGIPARTAIGVDEGSDFGPDLARETFAHELGHNLGLRHAPCGGAAGPDPNYPFPDGRTGTWGMDTFFGNVIKPPTGNDIMTYCPNQWVSGYNYRKVFDFRQQNPNGAGLRAEAPTLLISGGITNNVITLDPAFSLNTAPAVANGNGRFIAEGFDEANRRLFAWRFDSYPVDDGGVDHEAFVVAVPVTEAVQSRVVRLSVREMVGNRAAVRSSTGQLPTGTDRMPALSVSKVAGSKTQLQWSPSAVPAMMVRDRTTGEVLAFARNGTLDLSQFGADDRVDLLVSDGVKSARVQVNATTGVRRR